MEKKWWAKFGFLVVITIVAALNVYPTFSGRDLTASSFPFKQKINLGLDLQGGLYMVMGVDFNKVYKEVLGRQAQGLQARLTEKKFTVKNMKAVEGSPSDDPQFEFEFDSIAHDGIKTVIKDEYTSLRLTEESGTKIRFGVAHTYRIDIREKTIDQSIEVIRNRIDEFGVSEPTIASQGTDRLVIELPGVKDVDRAKDLIGKTAKLEFKIVNDKAPEGAKLPQIIAEIHEKEKLDPSAMKFSEYVEKLNGFAKGKIPADSMIAFEKAENQAAQGNVNQRMPYLLYSKAEVTGDLLQDAQVSFDQETGKPEVNFSFNPRGADAFGALTEANIRNRLAIVLDNSVFSAPTIQSKITNNGRITLGQGDYDSSMAEAKDLAIVLRAGALPAQLEFLEQRVVGPSLGRDSIKTGMFASIVGCLAVFLFTIFYYRTSGVIAVFSLILNVIFVMAILVGMEATLTLPGIAGIALTVGIAVDSNVVIYERIREELRAGKSIASAVDAGFQKAFRTIVDSNVTNAAAAIVLMNFGTGPIKGFAVTLLIGIVTTLFTAVFVCKMLFDWYLKVAEQKASPTLSI